MGDDDFLRALVEAPENAPLSLVYADWLEERSDPRAGLLRMRFVDSNRVREHREFYADRHPELRGRYFEPGVNRRWRDRVAALGSALDPSWLAAVDTLGRPFRPFFFWNNTGRWSVSFVPGALPFLEPIGTRGRLITFESAFRGRNAWTTGLARDVSFLYQLPLSVCEYGAASCPVHPFLCELEVRRRRLTGADVLRALKAADFRSQHIVALDVPAIPYPGYHPRTENDEIHNDPGGQCLFPRPQDVPESGYGDEAGGPAARVAVHDALRRAVVDGQLWYVLLHSRTRLPAGGLDRGPWVILFAVGRSRHGKRLLGVVSHQMCHNLCD